MRFVAKFLLRLDDFLGDRAVLNSELSLLLEGEFSKTREVLTTPDTDPWTALTIALTEFLSDLI